MKRIYSLSALLICASFAYADRPLVERLQQSGQAQKVHPQLMQKLERVSPSEKVPVWIRIKDRPQYEMKDLPSRGYLPPVNETYVNIAKNLPGAEFLSISELTNEVAVLIPASSVVNAIQVEAFDFIEESPVLQLEEYQEQTEVMGPPAYGAYQAVSYNAIQARQLQEATWGGYDWDSTNVTARNKHKKIAILDTGIWPYHPTFWLGEKPLPMTAMTSQGLTSAIIAATDSLIHLIPLLRYDPRDSLFYMRSRDYGVTWDSLQLIVSAPDNDWGLDEYRLAASSDPLGSYVIVAYLQNRWEGQDLRYELYAKASTNGGMTWQPPILLHTVLASPQWNGIKSIAIASSRSGNNSWAYVFWVEVRDTFVVDPGYWIYRERVKCRRTDIIGGNSWQPEQVIFEETAYQSFNLTGIDASADGSTVHVAFGREYPFVPTKDMFLFRSYTNGASWTQDRMVPSFSANPSVATKGLTGHVVFKADSSIYYFRSGSADPPLLLNATRKAYSDPAIASIMDTSTFNSPKVILHVCWIDRRDNRLNVYYVRHRDNGVNTISWDDGDTYVGNDNTDVTKKFSFNNESNFFYAGYDPIAIAALDETNERISTVHIAWTDIRRINNTRHHVWYANSSKIFAWKDYRGGKSKPDDYDVHGTSVSSIAAGCIVDRTSNDGAFNPYMGTSYNSVLAVATTSIDANLISAIKWAVDTIHADVINGSWGLVGADSGGHRVTQYVDWATGRGVVYTKSAGNNGPGASTITIPGDNFNALTVGGSLRDGSIIMPISSRGPLSDGRIKPDILAPGGDGDNIQGECTPTAGPDGDIHAARTPANGFYDCREGTSYAAPHVAGISAMLLQAHPNWSPGALRRALLATASAVTGNPRPNNNEGWGFIQANAANGYNTAPVPPSILPAAIDFQDSGNANSTVRLRILVKPNGGVDSVMASLRAFGQSGVLALSDSGIVSDGWHTYAANYQIPAGTSMGMKHVKVMAYRIGAGPHDTVWAYINLYVRPPQPTSVTSSENIPAEFALHQNYPNPFNPSTTIKYALPKDSHVRLSVYNVLGQEVARLVDAVQNAGYVEAVWDGRNTVGASVGSGVYFYRIEARPVQASTEPHYVEIKKMLLLK